MRGPIEHPLEGAGQAKERDRSQVRRERLDLDGGTTGEDVSARERTVRELVGGVAEALVLEQALDQLLTRVDTLLLGRVLLVEGVGRQQLPALEEGERRRHHQVLARDLDVERPRELDVLDVLLRDERDRDVEHVELVATHEVQEQIERSFEGVEGDRVGLPRADAVADGPQLDFRQRRGLGRRLRGLGPVGPRLRVLHRWSLGLGAHLDHHRLPDEVGRDEHRGKDEAEHPDCREP